MASRSSALHHVRLGMSTVAPEPGANPLQTPPLGCFDEKGQRLGPDDYVFGFDRVYAFDELTNQNPVIEGVTFDGNPVDLRDGIVVDRCKTVDDNTTKPDCKKHTLDVVVSPESQETRVEETDRPTKELIFASYYATGGKFGSDIRLLYEPHSGKVSGAENDFGCPVPPGAGAPLDCRPGQPRGHRLGRAAGRDPLS